MCSLNPRKWPEAAVDSSRESGTPFHHEGRLDRACLIIRESGRATTIEKLKILVLRRAEIKKNTLSLGAFRRERH
jgi:hypothetical protein